MNFIDEMLRWDMQDTNLGAGSGVLRTTVPTIQGYNPNDYTGMSVGERATHLGGTKTTAHPDKGATTTSELNWFGEGGIAPTMVSGVGTLMNGWLGMKQLDLAKKSLAENKRQFNMNWGAQKNLTNARLRDRQRARVASNPGAYQSVGDYMNQNGVK